MKEDDRVRSTFTNAGLSYSITGEETSRIMITIRKSNGDYVASCCHSRLQGRNGVINVWTWSHQIKRSGISEETNALIKAYLDEKMAFYRAKSIGDQ